MKEYNEKKPVVVVGGTAQDFFCEYMAGGVAILLGLTLKPGKPHLGRFIGTGMHGGRIFIRGDIAPNQLGKEVGERPLTDEDRALLEKYVNEYVKLFGGDAGRILKSNIRKYVPVSLRPYGNLYAY